MFCRTVEYVLPAVVELAQCGSDVTTTEQISRSPLVLTSHGTQLCQLYTRLDPALSEIEEAFQNTTLAESLSESIASTPSCDFSKE